MANKSRPVEATMHDLKQDCREASRLLTAADVEVPPWVSTVARMGSST
jgi:hypothetical protein